MNLSIFRLNFRNHEYEMGKTNLPRTFDGDLRRGCHLSFLLIGILLPTLAFVEIERDDDGDS